MSYSLGISHKNYRGGALSIRLAEYVQRSAVSVKHLGTSCEIERVINLNEAGMRLIRITVANAGLNERFYSTRLLFEKRVLVMPDQNTANGARWSLDNQR